MGEVFAGRYELLDPIATGGMGTVWRVHDRTDGDVLAAKMLRQTDAAMLLRFVREQSVRIDHTHIVAPKSWAGLDDRVLFTMPLVRGGSVSGLVKRNGGTLPARWVAAIADQTLQALEAVHQAGIVHRDVKTANLLLEPTGTGRPHVRLTDFGIAVPRDEPRLTHVAMVIGTPGYMAPEQYNGADPDPSADVYALGVVMLEMLTGQRPSGEGAPPPIDVSGLRGHHPDHDALLDVIAAATAYDAPGRPSAAELRAMPALQSLIGRWDDPALADGVEVRDEYPDDELVTTMGIPSQPTAPPPPPPSSSPSSMATSAYPPPTPPAGIAMPTATAAETRFDQPTPRAVSPRRVPIDAIVLLSVGVIGLIVALVLLFS